MDYLSRKRRTCRQEKHPVLYRIIGFLKNLPFMYGFKKPCHELRVFPKGWLIAPDAGLEKLFEKADAYREYLLRLKTPQPVDAIPNEVGWVLYDDLKMVDRYDGLLFLTKLGVMYLKDRGLS